MGVASKTCDCCACLGSCACCVATPILCCVCTFLVFLVVIAGGTALALYFILLPKAPEVSLVSQQVQMFNASSLTADPVVNGSLSFTYQIHNPNKVNVEFQNSTSQLFYYGLSLGSAAIPSFTEGAKSSENKTTNVSFQTLITSSYQTNFLSQYQNGSIPLEIQFTLPGNIQIWGIASPKTKVLLSCDLTLNVYSRALVSTGCRTAKEFTK